MKPKLKKFLQKIVCCFVPSRRMRIRIRGNFDRVLYYKAKKALVLAPQIETLVVGSSHAQCGFYETKQDLNLGVASQDLYYSYQLYMKCRLMLSNLKRVVLFYSDFSAGFEEERTHMIFETLKYNQYFGIPPKNPVLYAEKNMDISLNFAPFEIKEFTFDDPYPFPFFAEGLTTPEGIKDRAEKHLKNAMRDNNQTAFVEKLIRAVMADGLQLLIVVPPVTAEYLSHVPADLNVFGQLEKVLDKFKGQVKYLNCYRDTDFVQSDFSDCDHLNRQGAEKLTAKIHQAFSSGA